MNTENHISDTAFLVNESRLQKLDVSKDIYAKYWVQPESYLRVHKLWNDFSKEVYPYDNIELAIRNRYFLEHLQNFINTRTNVVFINFGAGFTSYPFLINKNILCLEIDYHHVIEYKKNRVKQLQKNGVLPNRNIEFYSVDFNNFNECKKLKKWLAKKVKNTDSFILLEGVSYYLSIPVLNVIIELSRDIQSINSIFAFGYWRPHLITHPIFKKLQSFFSKKFGQETYNYNLFDKTFIQSINGYKILEITDVSKQEKILSNTNLLNDYNNILPENYAILSRD